MAAALSLAYTTTPLAASTKLAIFASGQLSAGKMRVNARSLRLLTVTAAAATSPANILAAYNTAHGTLVTGKKIFFRLVVLSSTGIASAPLDFSQVIA